MGREGGTHHFEAASLCDAAETDCERGARGCIGGSPAPYGHARALAYEHMPRAVGIVTGPRRRLSRAAAREHSGARTLWKVRPISPDDPVGKDGVRDPVAVLCLLCDQVL